MAWNPKITAHDKSAFAEAETLGLRLKWRDPETRKERAGFIPYGEVTKLRVDADSSPYEGSPATGVAFGVLGVIAIVLMYSFASEQLSPREFEELVSMSILAGIAAGIIAFILPNKHKHLVKVYVEGRGPAMDELADSTGRLTVPLGTAIVTKKSSAEFVPGNVPRMG